jgi:hypothetical protein
MAKEKTIVIESKTCHACKDQNIAFKKAHVEDKFRVVYVQNKNSEPVLKKAKQHGMKIKGTPTFICPGYTCMEGGMKGPGLLKDFLKRSNSPNPNPTQKQQQRSWGKSLLLIPLIAIELLVLFLIILPP